MTIRPSRFKKKKATSAALSTSSGAASKTSSGKPIRKIEDCTYSIGSNRKSGNYARTTEYILTHINKTVKPQGDVWSRVLETGVPVDYMAAIPPLKIVQRQPTDDGYREEVKAVDHYNSKQIDAQYKLQQHYDQNRGEVYGILFDRCDEKLRERLRERYPAIVNSRDPIGLLEKIKMESLGYDDNEKVHRCVTEALRTLLTTAQRSDESVGYLLIICDGI